MTTQDLVQRLEKARNVASALRLRYNIIPFVRIIKKFKALKNYAHANTEYLKIYNQYQKAREREKFSGRNWGVPE